MTIRQCSSCGGFCKKSGCEREHEESVGSIAFLRKECSRQATLIKCLGSALEGLAYYWMNNGKPELCGFSTQEGEKNFEPADHALCAYKEWKEKK